MHYWPVKLSIKILKSVNRVRVVFKIDYWHLYPPPLHLHCRFGSVALSSVSGTFRLHAVGNKLIFTPRSDQIKQGPVKPRVVRRVSTAVYSPSAKQKADAFRFSIHNSKINFNCGAVTTYLQCYYFEKPIICIMPTENRQLNLQM